MFKNVNLYTQEAGKLDYFVKVLNVTVSVFSIFKFVRFFFLNSYRLLVEIINIFSCSGHFIEE